MCGFCGFTKNLYKENTNNIIKNMTNKITHRGPDGEGFFEDDFISLGFRRLSFLDLENGSQPMTNKNNNLTIVFNGEIYNFKDIKDELIKKGRSFDTTSDTEVLLQLYEEHGCDMLHHLRGMFAFVIYNHNSNEVFAVRDFFGIKPLYYGVFEGELLFASEIKAFLEHPAFKKELNLEALQHYLSFQYSATDESFFKNVYKLPAAHYLSYKSGDIDIKRYWKAQFKEGDDALETYIEKIDQVMKDSVNYHQVSDVPIGSFLSSGVDSSYVASIFNGKKTFTVGFDYERYNEISYAEALSQSKGIESVSKIISTQEYWQALRNIQYHMDEPLADPSAVALYFLSKLASGHVKGVLSGEGADEFFGGYNIYKEPISLMPLSCLPRFIRRFLAGVARLIPLKFKGKNYLIRASKSVEQRFIGNANIFSEKEKSIILKRSLDKTPQDIIKKYYDQVPCYDDITKMQHIDLHFWLVGDILLKADKMSMANSLEARVPILDKEVFKVAASLPTRFRVNKEATKYAFRLAAKRHMDDKFASKKKLGFPVPIRIWLKEDVHYNTVKSAFKQDFVSQFFYVDKLMALLDKHKKGKADNSRKIWTVYMFVLWYEEFFVKN